MLSHGTRSSVSQFFWVTLILFRELSEGLIFAMRKERNGASLLCSIAGVCMPSRQAPDWEFGGDTVGPVTAFSRLLCPVFEPKNTRMRTANVWEAVLRLGFQELA
jgi:hypothetical protein